MSLGAVIAVGLSGCITAPTVPAVTAPAGVRMPSGSEPQPELAAPAELGVPAELGTPATLGDPAESPAPVFPNEPFGMHFPPRGFLPANPHARVGLPYWAYLRRPVRPDVQGASLTGTLESPKVRPIKSETGRNVPAQRQSLPRVEELPPPP